MNKIKYPTLRLCIVTLIVATLSHKAMSASSSSSGSDNDFSASLGNLCEYVGQIQTNDKGGKNFCSFLPVLSLSYAYFATPNFAIVPQVGASLPKSGRDENIKRMTMFSLINAKYKTTYVNLVGGLGLYFTRIWGPGGEEALNNGNSTDSFPLPKDPVYTRNFIVNLGLSTDLSEEVSAEVYTYIFNAVKKEDRALSVGLSLSYHFGEIL